MATASCRAAPEELDEQLTTILANSFLPLWNHNWFHGVSEPLERLPQQSSLSAPSPSLEQLTPLQRGRRTLYRLLLKLTRGVGGDVSIITIPNPKDPSSELIAAILMWCPPHKRNASTFGLQFIKDLWLLYQAGVVPAIRAYGIGGFQRVTDQFEANVQRMFKESLASRGFKPEECAFVQNTAVNTDPEFDDVLNGKGFARRLLQWRIERHWEECKDSKTGTSGKMTPVILDTTTEQGITAYERSGFELVNDKNGYKLPKGLLKEEKERLAAEAKKHCVMTIMIKMPPDSEAS